MGYIHENWRCSYIFENYITNIIKWDTWHGFVLNLYSPHCHNPMLYHSMFPHENCNFSSFNGYPGIPIFRHIHMGLGWVKSSWATIYGIWDTGSVFWGLLHPAMLGRWKRSLSWIMAMLPRAHADHQPELHRPSSHAILADGAWKFSRANPASFPALLPTFFPELAAGLIKFSLWDAESMQTQIAQSVPSLPTNLPKALKAQLSLRNHVFSSISQ